MAAKATTTKTTVAKTTVTKTTRKKTGKNSVRINRVEYGKPCSTQSRFPATAALDTPISMQRLFVMLYSPKDTCIVGRNGMH